MKRTEANSNTLIVAPQEARLMNDASQRNQESKTKVGRNQMIKLHEPSDKTSKAIGTAKDAIGEAVNSGSNVLVKSLVGLRDKVSNSAKGNGVGSKLGFGILGTTLGLSTVKSVLETVKSIFGNSKSGGKASNILLSGGQALFGGALALGTFRTLLGTSGMFNMGTIVTGLIGFGVFSLIKSSYQDSESYGAKILGMLGLKETTESLIDSFTFNTVTNDEVIR